MNRRRTVVSIVGTAALAVAGLSVSGSGPASAAPDVTCSSVVNGQSTHPNQGDIDGDHAGDPVIGMPNIGAVDVHLGSGAKRITEGQLTENPSGKFGTAAVSGYVNGDFCADLIVSAPGTNGAAGSVYIIPGSDDGPVVSAAIRLPAPDGAGSSWGASLAFLSQTHTLAVGAPSSPLSPQSGGAVLLYPLSAGGAPGSPKIVTQGADGVAGASEAGDRFGAALASTVANVYFDASQQKPVYEDSLAIGAPGEAIGTEANAGAVTVLDFSGPTAFGAASFNQNTTRCFPYTGGNPYCHKVPGTAEAGDEFGAALASFGTDVAVGVPGESIGSAIHTGLVDHMALDDVDSAGRPQFGGATQLDQNTEGIPGTNESGDRFGSSVALYVRLYVEIAVGAPYEDVGSAKDAGSVTTITIPSEADYFGYSLTQGSKAFGGKAEKGDHFGWSVATEPDGDFTWDGEEDWVVVGDPGEDLAGVGTDAGYAYRMRLDNSSAALLPVGGAKAGLAYGTVLGSPRPGTGS